MEGMEGAEGIAGIALPASSFSNCCTASFLVNCSFLAISNTDNIAKRPLL